MDWGGMLCLELYDGSAVSDIDESIVEWKRYWQLGMNVVAAEGEASVALRVWDRLHELTGTKSKRSFDHVDTGIYVIDRGESSQSGRMKRIKKAKKEKKEKKGKKRKKKERHHARDIAAALA